MTTTQECPAHHFRYLTKTSHSSFGMFNVGQSQSFWETRFVLVGHGDLSMESVNTEDDVDGLVNIF